MRLVLVLWHHRILRELVEFFDSSGHLVQGRVDRVHHVRDLPDRG